MSCYVFKEKAIMLTSWKSAHTIGILKRKNERRVQRATADEEQGKYVA